MKKICLALIGLLTQTALWAQDSTSTKILASDPTQVYTHIDFNGGINFESTPGYFGPESWTFNLECNFAVGNFLLGTRLPLTNFGSSYSLLGDVDVFAGYKLFNQTKTLKTSLLYGGVSFPTSYDGYGPSIIREDGFFNYYMNYTAGIQVSPKLSVYPKIGINYSKSVEQGVFVTIINDTTYEFYYPPDYTRLAITAGITASYDFNKKSFVQVVFDYSRGKWKSSDETALPWLGINESTNYKYSASLKYQYSINSRSFLYLQGVFNSKNTFENPMKIKSGYNTSSIILGYQYYLK